MDYETVHHSQIVLCGITARVRNSDPAKIGELWNRFYAEPFVDRLTIEDGAVYSAYFDYESDHTGPYTTLLGFRVLHGQPAPDGLTLLTINPATYAMLRRTGPMPATVVEAWQQVWGSDLPRTYIADFDRYASPDTVEVNVGIA
jgi:predicted transcriptional regulator YdeE